MRPHFVFPSDSFDDAVDEMFRDQIDTLAAVGFSVSLCPEGVDTEGRQLKGVPPGSRVVYRGWMLAADEYATLAGAIEAAGGAPWTSPRQYLATHHLPNWYPLITDLTPETRVLNCDADLASELKALAWPAFFVKDYVKSLKTSVGSLVRDPDQIEQVVDEMKAYRGEIEGGVCVRRVEDFLPETERRYFVVNGVPFAADESEAIPEVVAACAGRIPSPFFSVDAVRRADGALRVVEVGDGQVSDLVGWSPATFANMWRRIS